jgi:hypothetical protein
MLNIFLSANSISTNLVAMSDRAGADFKLRPHLRNLMQIGVLRKASLKA